MTPESFLAHLFAMQPAPAQFYDRNLGHQWHEDNIRAHMGRLAAAPAPGSEPTNPTTTLDSADFDGC